jgi:23S rRNA U2552 (ribose-2'-O)-methylase RlmE/FtsJ
MSYYLLPKTSVIIHKYIDCIEKEAVPLPVISNSLSTYLYETKKKLDEREKDWDIFKKYTNPYEYIHTVIPFKKKCVSKHKPLSRSYFKMIEIVNTFGLTFESKPIKTFHLAEGPGGFIEAMVHLRRCPHDTYIGMTIIDEDQDPNIPGWKKSDAFLRQNKNVYIEYGADNTGNILTLENFIHCKENHASSMELITADGGFDFSMDFNNQEIHIAKLLFAQMAFAVCMQKKGGSFILKMFDCFMQHSVDLLYILSSFYEKVHVMKPHTSRYANSEKYIVCKGFLFNTCEHFYPFIHRAFEKMTAIPQNDTSIHIHRFMSLPIPYCFLIKLEEYNAIFGQQQIENIHYTISLIENKHKQEKIDNLVKINIQKCIQWCMKHNVPYQQILANTNMFIQPNYTDSQENLNLESIFDIYVN